MKYHEALSILKREVTSNLDQTKASLKSRCLSRGWMSQYLEIESDGVLGGKVVAAIHSKQ